MKQRTFFIWVFVFMVLVVIGSQSSDELDSPLREVIGVPMLALPCWYFFVRKNKWR